MGLTRERTGGQQALCVTKTVGGCIPRLVSDNREVHQGGMLHTFHAHAHVACTGCVGHPAAWQLAKVHMPPSRYLMHCIGAWPEVTRGYHV